MIARFCGVQRKKSAYRLFVLFHPSKPRHPTQPIPPNPHQIKQPLSKIAVNEIAVSPIKILLVFWEIEVDFY
ncbi:MAG: hypothetical protein ACI307_01400 [Sodaliphilus sp.]